MINKVVSANANANADADDWVATYALLDFVRRAKSDTYSLKFQHEITNNKQSIANIRVTESCETHRRKCHTGP